MAVKTRVLEIVTTDPVEAQAQINAELTSLPMSSAEYIESLVVAFQEKNQTAFIVIWYDDGT